MMMSPCRKCFAASSTVSSVGLPLGTMTQMTVGWSSTRDLPIASSSELAAIAPSSAYACTVSDLRSNATTPCPAFIKRRVMLPPIRPKPIMLSFMGSSITQVNHKARDLDARVKISSVGDNFEAHFSSIHSFQAARGFYNQRAVGSQIYCHTSKTRAVRFEHVHFTSQGRV